MSRLGGYKKVNKVATSRIPDRKRQYPVGKLLNKLWNHGEALVFKHIRDGCSGL